MNRGQTNGRGQETTGKIKKSEGQAIGYPRMDLVNAMFEVNGMAQNSAGFLKRKSNKRFENA